MWIGYADKDFDDDVYNNAMECDEDIERYIEAMRENFYRGWFEYLEGAYQ